MQGSECPGPSRRTTASRLRPSRSIGLLVGLGMLVTGCAAENGDPWAGGLETVTGVLGAAGVGNGGELGRSEIAAGLREALKVGSGRVVTTLGRPGGFLDDPKVRIPLPAPLARVQSSLRTIGASGLVDDLELRMNRAAEQATPIAKDLFWQAITSLTFDDVLAIYQGPNDAATQYLDRTTRSSLTEAMRPIIDQTLADAGAIAAYDAIVARAAVSPLLPNFKADLTNHVLGRAMDGLFGYLAVEEAAIREDPAKRTTDLLKRVFGANS
jgi:hypothetical protein